MRGRPAGWSVRCRRRYARRWPGSWHLPGGLVGHRAGDQADDLVLGCGCDVTDAGDAAQPHDLDPVGDVEDEVHVVADADDRGAPAAQLTDEIGGMCGLADTQGCRRLVEQDDPGA